jgi:predicted transcriptional regulator
VRKPGPRREIPPPLELECLKVLWTLKEGSVKDVVEVLAKNDRMLAYTTVLTVLDRLVKRGAVERRKRGRAFLFAPVLDIERARRSAVRELIATYFSGSVEQLHAYLETSEERAEAQPESASAAAAADDGAGLDPTLL